jgi:hypothetical protein
MIFTTLSSANDFVQVANAALGYPSSGTPIGPGPHAANSQTLTWATPRKHPKKNEWQVPHDDRLEVVRGAAGRIMPNPIAQAKYDAAMAKLDAAIDLPADWDPEVTP